MADETHGHSNDVTIHGYPSPKVLTAAGDIAGKVNALLAQARAANPTGLYVTPCEYPGCVYTSVQGPAYHATEHARLALYARLGLPTTANHVALVAALLDRIEVLEALVPRHGPQCHGDGCTGCGGT